ncbi:hypothetical protein H6G17_26990 [Chroococcidiopsis sp. FACHB-1243]|uniref:hypothetical protein n=1 Tax=Chroococcidiopsis sp. [FACHB-1243] TaxID=2692781 RepID=UPI0017833F0E|nr:hypothetical protein [Chroococcidiopsis sp. [FACHB-1243]]MBD2309110.1 hypothetical protein [Chroococcidiopsis sp. [FACHB-1243]]
MNELKLRIRELSATAAFLSKQAIAAFKQTDFAQERVFRNNGDYIYQLTETEGKYQLQQFCSTDRIKSKTFDDLKMKTNRGFAAIG